MLSGLIQPIPSSCFKAQTHRLQPFEPTRPKAKAPFRSSPN
jgi:hypothetical protein